MRYGYSIKGGTSVHALLRPAVHGRVSGSTLYIGEVWHEGQGVGHWRNDQTSDHYRTQEEAAKALYAIVATPEALKRARDRELGLTQ